MTLPPQSPSSALYYDHHIRKHCALGTTFALRFHYWSGRWINSIELDQLTRFVLLVPFPDLPEPVRWPTGFEVAIISHTEIINPRSYTQKATKISTILRKLEFSSRLISLHSTNCRKKPNPTPTSVSDFLLFGRQRVMTCILFFLWYILRFALSRTSSEGAF